MEELQRLRTVPSVTSHGSGMSFTLKSNLPQRLMILPTSLRTSERSKIISLIQSMEAKLRLDYAISVGKAATVSVKCGVEIRLSDWRSCQRQRCV